MTNKKARSIKVDTIEQKVICGQAICRNGYIYNFCEGIDTDSSDEGDTKNENDWLIDF